MNERPVQVSEQKSDVSNTSTGPTNNFKSCVYFYTHAHIYTYTHAFHCHHPN